MKREIMEQWVKALRSGEYKQAKGSLIGPAFTENATEETTQLGYCCLGVLCDISKQGKFGEQEDSDGDVLEYLGETELLPEKVEEWAGMHSTNGRLPLDEKNKTIAIELNGDKPDNERLTLATLNDKGYTFKQIAKFIERYWEDL